MLNYTVYRSKKDKPWVTFIHGAGGSSTIWFKQIKSFSKFFNLLLIDLRGHGKSKHHMLEELKAASNPKETALIFGAIFSMSILITGASTFFATQRFLNLTTDAVN